MLTHIRRLLRAANAPGDALLTAQLLAAGLDAGLVLHQIRDQNVPLSLIADNWETVVRQLAGRRLTTTFWFVSFVAVHGRSKFGGLDPSPRGVDGRAGDVGSVR